MKTPAGQIGVLFVCTGNICRSPTAEAVFRHQVEKAGLAGRFLIDSAGTHGYHIGDPPDPRSVAAALEQGVDMRSLRARKVENADFSRFDHILAMDAGHHDILFRFGDVRRLSMFMDGRDVPDPYYGPLAEFGDVYTLIERGCRDLLQKLRHIHDL